MATGDTMATLEARDALPTVTLGATIDTIADASTPAGITPVLDFDGSAQDEHAEWQFEVPSTYGGGGFSCVVKYAMSGTDADAVQFELRALTLVDTSDLDSDLGMDTQTGTDVTDTPTGTANAMMVCAAGTITHANAGSPAVGNRVRFRLTRDYDHASNTDDAQVVSIHIREA